MKIVKIVEFKEQYRITIPKDLVKSKGWNSKTELRFIEAPDGTITLKEIEKKKGGNDGKKQ